MSFTANAKVASPEAIVAASETTPLLPDATSAKPNYDSALTASSDASSLVKTPSKSQTGNLLRVYTCTFIICLSIGMMQIPMIFSFRTLPCQEYYKTHPIPPNKGDPAKGDAVCDIIYVNIEQARQVTISVMVAMVSSVVNLFFTTHLQTRYGLRAAMFQQTIWITLRNICIVWGLKMGAKEGLIFIQLILATNILGGIGGVQLAGNNYVAELSSPEDRTGNFGVFTGVTMAASAIGLTFGGWLYGFFGPLMPFEAAFVASFIGLVSVFFMPYLAPEKREPKNVENGPANLGGPGAKKANDGRGILAPLQAIMPTRVEMADGKSRLDFNVTLLAIGAFLSTLATVYVPFGLQLIGTEVFGFKPLQGGLMQSVATGVKAIFLTFAFPRIIKTGRKIIARRSSSAVNPADDSDTETLTSAPQEPKGTLFDLFFLRYSIFIDGIITALVYLAAEPWHLFLAAGVIPLASGTGPACRGVVLDLVGPHRKANTLAAIQIMERIGFICTNGIFGVIFGVLTEAGNPTAIFLVNGAMAMVAFLLLFLVRMPKERKVRLD